MCHHSQLACKKSQLIVLLRERERERENQATWFSRLEWHIYACVFGYMYERMYVCMYLCMYSCMYARMLNFNNSRFRVAWLSRLKYYLFICMYVSMYVYVWKVALDFWGSNIIYLLCLYSCVCMYVYMYVYMQVKGSARLSGLAFNLFICTTHVDHTRIHTWKNYLNYCFSLVQVYVNWFYCICDYVCTN
jgi:hypothetical protein